MQHEHCMSRKILKTIEGIIDNDPNLREFSIVPTGDENLKNKSPVLYEENNLGLESWCIKYVYRYVYPELLEARKRKLSPQELQNLNHLLIGALLINPDIYTFWNMKRELVEREVLDVHREFLFAKLVLSHKSKSNEAYAYRRWLVGKILSKYNEAALIERLYRGELEAAKMAAEKAANNYHAVNHRIWAFNAIVGSNADLARGFVISELMWSKEWVFEHVSEHVGYHYRQFLIEQVKTRCNSLSEFDRYYRDVKTFVQCTENVSYVTILRDLLGAEYSNHATFVNYFSVLLYDLFYTLATLQRMFPDHESVWYYRRYIIYHIILGIYEVSGVKFKTNRSISSSSSCGKSNFIASVLNGEQTGDTLPKILKYEPNKIETILLYTILVKYERYYLNVSCSGAAYAKRHKKWLQLYLEMYDL